MSNPLSLNAEELKNQGNAHFKAQEWAKAYDFYSRAITESPDSATLYSNRSAAAAKMDDFPQALKDAKKAVECDPKWHKAHVRLATAHVLLGEKTYARNEYMHAHRLATDAALKIEYKRYAEKLDEQITSQYLSSTMNGSLDNETDPLQRFLKLRSLGHVFRRDSAAVRFMNARTTVENAWKDIHKLRSLKTYPDGRPLPPGTDDLLFGRLGMVSALTSGILQDPINAFMFRASEEYRDPIDLIQKQIAFEFARFKAPSDSTSPAEVINSIEVIREEKGWYDSPDGKVYGAVMIVQPSLDGDFDRARTILRFCIRWAVLFGLVMELALSDSRSALKSYVRAVEIIELAHARWPGQDNPDQVGTSVIPSFYRGVQGRRLRCMMNIAAKSPESDTNDVLADIEALANKLLRSCNESPIMLSSSLDTPEIADWVAFYRVSRGDAHMALGFVNYRRTMKDILPNEAQTWLCMQHYAQAAAWYPQDDENRVDALWYTAAAAIRLGSLTLPSLNEIIKLAKEAEVAHELVFGWRGSHNDMIDWVMEGKEEFEERIVHEGAFDHEGKPLTMKMLPMTLRASKLSERQLEAAKREALKDPSAHQGVEWKKFYAQAKAQLEKEMENGPDMLGPH